MHIVQIPQLPLDSIPLTAVCFRLNLMNVPSPEQKNNARYAAVRARMKDPKVGFKMLATKGARHAHASILAQGRKLCAEAIAARKRNAAARRLAKQQDAELGRQWRSSSTDLTGI